MDLQEQRVSLLEQIKTKRQYIDKTFWALFIILAVISVISLFSASTYLINKAGGNIYAPIFSHVLALCVGIGAAYLIQFLPSWAIRLVSYLGLAFAILCLLLTFTPFGVEINGETRWVQIFGITFQPSEIAKITLVIVISDLLSRIKSEESKRKIFWIVLGLAGFVCGMILPTNLSTALLIGIVIFILMFLARIPLLWLGSIVLIAGTLLVGGYFYVDKMYIEKGEHMSGPLGRAETWVSRVNDAFAEEDASTFRFHDNYQANMAEVAVARGGQTPFGVLPGNSWAREKLPGAHSDFIFSIITEEWGLIGSIFIIFIYLAILFRACYASSRYNDYSAMLMMMGLALMITMQAFISMEVSVGLGPVTGQPLPLISDGTTSIFICCIYFGCMMAVSREQKEKKALQEQAIHESEETVPDLDVEL